MTVSSTSSRVVANGDGSNTAWPFAFKIPTSADIVVVYTDLTGTDFTLSYGTQYSATGFGVDAGGTVTYPLSGSPIALGTKLTIYRMMALTQPSAISNQGAMWPSVIEGALDRLTFMAQAVADGLSRSLKVSPTDSQALNELPDVTTRANSVLGFNASGQPYAATLTGSLVGVATWLVTNFLPAGTTRAAALAALGGAGLAENNAQTGNNTHAGTETFNGAATFGSTAAFNGVATFNAGMSLIQRIQKFTVTGTYTPHAKMVHCVIECWGGGGGGGGAVVAATAGDVATGGGGGAGGYSKTISTAAAIGASKAVTIGAAGTAGAAGNNAGVAGGDTSVTTLCVGKGGTGGGGHAGTSLAVATAGAGGVAGTGDVTLIGQSGDIGAAYSHSVASRGGDSPPVGSGGQANGGAGASAGGAGAGFAAGGGGGYAPAGTSNAAAGAGTAGYIIITEFCSV